LNLYPFTVANACQQTGNRLVALKTQPNVNIVIAKQAQWRKRQFDVHSFIGPSTSLAWKFQENMLTNFLIGTATPVTLSSTHHIPPKKQWAPPWLTPLSLALIFNPKDQSKHPTTAFPRQHALLLPHDLANLSTVISSNSLFDWHRWVCFPLSILLMRPPIRRGYLTSSIKSRINTYLQSAGLPVKFSNVFSQAKVLCEKRQF